MRKMGQGFMRSRYDRYIFAMLLALEILMSFTFLGYIHIPPVSITYAFIPILGAGVLLGPVPAMAVGAVFGLCSMYKASAFYVMPGDQIFSPFVSGAPVESFLLSVGTRTLFGLTAGLLLSWAGKRRHGAIFLGIAAFCSRRIHSVFVYAFMGLFFPEQGTDLAYGLLKAPSISDLLLDGVCLLAVEAVWRFHRSDASKKIRSYIDLGGETLGKDAWDGRRHRRLFASAAAVVLCAIAASAIYFARRTFYMLTTHGMFLEDAVQYDLLHLQTQFLMAVLSLCAIMWLLFMTTYQYLLYREYLGRLDGLTGIMGRSMFLGYCRRRLQENSASGREGCFIFVDVDHFKGINDTLGHPTGDMVLRTVAERLRECFSGKGQAGRMGGDEFAVFLDQAVPRPALEALLDRFLEEVSGILPEYGRVTCSIGSFYFSYGEELDRIYEETDRLLYKAKQQGRAQYVTGGDPGCGDWEKRSGPMRGA